ncbi:MAG TPA: transporter substrate-binding domain-containing protein [Cryomorphaceae bacterium]|nr:transporter substrate-binding domain-containing protein [Cryomorphaceae bacterium]
MKICTLAIALILAIIGYSQTTQLGLAYDVWPPFTNTPGETAVATEIVKTALNRNSIAVKERVLDFETVIKGLKAKSFQGSPALWKTSDREEFLLYSKPILYNQLILVGLKGADVSASSMADLKGKRVGLVEGYAYGDEIENVEGVYFTDGKSDQANVLMLLEKKLDYILVDGLLVAYLRSYQAKDAEKHLELGDTPLLTKALCFAIQRDIEDAEKLMSNFNETILEMQVDGTYHRILKLNWIQIDVDGDGVLEMIPGTHAGRLTKNTYSINGKSSDSSNIYYNGKRLNWEELPEDVKRTGINNQDMKDVTFMSFGL